MTGVPQPLAVGYLRCDPTDPPAFRTTLIAELHAYADHHGLILDEIHTDLLDPPAGIPDRSGFAALMDALRRTHIHAVIIPSPQHLSRRLSSYTSRRAIIESETGTRLLAIHTAPLWPTGQCSPSRRGPRARDRE